MYPTFLTLTSTPDTLRIVAYVACVLLAGFIVYDGHREHGRQHLVRTLFTAVGFLAVGLVLISFFVTPDRLPERFTIPLRSWGLMVVIGMMVCFLVQRHYGMKTGLNSDQILSIWIYGGLAAAFGARLLHVVVNWRDYEAAPLGALTFWDGGMAFIGGALAALVFTMLYLRRRGLGLGSLDALVLGVALSHGIGRIGCFLAGCCYGQDTSAPIGVSFPPGSIAQFIFATEGRIAPDAWTPHLHPTQLYSVVMCFAVGFTLLWLHRRRDTVPGMVTAAYLVLYPLGRFTVELVRGDPERQFAFRYPAENPVILSTTQTVALFLIPVGLFAYAKLRKRRSPRTFTTEKTDEPVLSPQT
ncbi:MAG: prolipoprotein diacylglyceryl transferase [Deltaproteobacteria bacterium]|nr:prolipoprotein diacylglyceryl transferase [Deltaproteobacteria bacterium]